MRDLKSDIIDWLETLTPDHLGAILRVEVRKTSPNFEFIQDLLAVGCPINAVDQDGQTALHIAANILNLDVMEFLISVGADVNARNYIGDTASDTYDRAIRLRKNIAKARELVKKRKGS